MFDFPRVQGYFDTLYTIIFPAVERSLKNSFSPDSREVGQYVCFLSRTVRTWTRLFQSRSSRRVQHLHGLLPTDKSKPFWGIHNFSLVWTSASQKVGQVLPQSARFHEKQELLLVQQQRLDKDIQSTQLLYKRKPKDSKEDTTSTSCSYKITYLILVQYKRLL